MDMLFSVATKKPGLRLNEVYPPSLQNVVKFENDHISKGKNVKRED